MKIPGTAGEETPNEHAVNPTTRYGSFPERRDFNVDPNIR